MPRPDSATNKATWQLGSLAAWQLATGNLQLVASANCQAAGQNKEQQKAQFITELRGLGSRKFA